MEIAEAAAEPPSQSAAAPTPSAAEPAWAEAASSAPSFLRPSDPPAPEAETPAAEAPAEPIPEPAPIPVFGRASTVPDRQAAAPQEFDYDDTPKRRTRRNPARYWTMGAIAFALAAALAAAALWYFGPPQWAVNLGLVANRNEPELLFYLPKPPERRKLPTGEEYFAFSGRVVNSASEELSVPPIVVELRDAQGRLVFSWMTKADKARLKPNEEARVSESRLDIPKNARNLSLKFVDNSQ